MSSWSQHEFKEMIDWLARAGGDIEKLEQMSMRELLQERERLVQFDPGVGEYRSLQTGAIVKTRRWNSDDDTYEEWLPRRNYAPTQTQRHN